MQGKRTYDDLCGAARGLDLVGERWALLVVREMVFGPKRFTDLRAGLPGISANVLTQRLHELEESGIVARRKLAPPSRAAVYELTDWGADLAPILRQLGAWASRSADLAPATHFSPDSCAISLQTLFQRGDVFGTYEIRFGDDVFRVDVRGDEVEVARGRAANPVATVDASPLVLAGLLYDGQDLDAAIDSGEVRITGDRDAVKRFLTVFSLPAPVAA